MKHIICLCTALILAIDTHGSLAGLSDITTQPIKRAEGVYVSICLPQRPTVLIHGAIWLENNYTVVYQKTGKTPQMIRAFTSPIIPAAASLTASALLWRWAARSELSTSSQRAIGEIIALLVTVACAQVPAIWHNGCNLVNHCKALQKAIEPRATDRIPNNIVDGLKSQMSITSAQDLYWETLPIKQAYRPQYGSGCVPLFYDENNKRATMAFIYMQQTSKEIIQECNSIRDEAALYRAYNKFISRKGVKQALFEAFSNEIIDILSDIKPHYYTGSYNIEQCSPEDLYWRVPTTQERIVYVPATVRTAIVDAYGRAGLRINLQSWASRIDKERSNTQSRTLQEFNTILASAGITERCSATSNQATIKYLFRKASLKKHPDKFKPEEREQAAEEFKKLSELRDQLLTFAPEA